MEKFYRFIEEQLYFYATLIEPCHHMRKPTFCKCENKVEDERCGADERLYFRYIDSTIPLLPKIRNFRPLAIFCDCAIRFVSGLGGNP